MSLRARRFRPRPRETRAGRGCAAKRRYRSVHEAERVRLHCEANRGTRLRVYDCGRCRGWHMTSRPLRR